MNTIHETLVRCLQHELRKLIGAWSSPIWPFKKSASVFKPVTCSASGRSTPKRLALKGADVAHVLQQLAFDACERTSDRPSQPPSLLSECFRRCSSSSCRTPRVKRKPYETVKHRQTIRKRV